MNYIANSFYIISTHIDLHLYPILFIEHILFGIATCHTNKNEETIERTNTFQKLFLNSINKPYHIIHSYYLYTFIAIQTNMFRCHHPIIIKRNYLNSLFTFKKILKHNNVFE